MIIKKRKPQIINEPQEEIIEEIEDIEDGFLEEPEEDSPEPLVQERQERRRGDRRRGYRRVDDRNLISRAHEEANTIKENAVKEGFEHGLTSSKSEIERINQTLAEFLNAKEDALIMATDEIVEIAIKVAEKIIKTEVACDETIILNIVSDVLKSLGKDETNIIVKTNPTDTQVVRENLPKIFPFGDTSAKIVVMEEENVEWGSCIVQTNNGIVDAQFSTQIEILRKALETGKAT